MTHLDDVELVLLLELDLEHLGVVLEEALRPQPALLHLHITLHYIALHCIIVHHITLITVPEEALRPQPALLHLHITLYYITLHCITLHYIAL